MDFSEILVSEDMDLNLIGDEWHCVIKKQPSSLFHYTSCLEQICSYYSVISLDGIGSFKEGEIIAAGVLLSYLKLTQCGKIPIFSMIENETENNFLEISNQVRLNSNIENKPVRIIEEDNKFIRDDAIGEISIRDIEKEAIIRTLRFFNTNRRKTAKSLGMSERTLYRKIDEYGLETKIRKNPK